MKCVAAGHVCDVPDDEVPGGRGCSLLPEDARQEAVGIKTSLKVGAGTQNLAGGPDFWSVLLPLCR